MKTFVVRHAAKWSAVPCPAQDATPLRFVANYERAGLFSDQVGRVLRMDLLPQSLTFKETQPLDKLGPLDVRDKLLYNVYGKITLSIA